MEDNTTEVEETTTEDTDTVEEPTLNIRGSLRKQLSSGSDKAQEEKAHEPVKETKEEVTPDNKEPAPPVEASPSETQVVPQDTVLRAPPADMNKAEKEAFLNPSPQNAHVLQAYLNRRAYETRSDYSRKMQEVEQLKQQTAGLYDSIRQYENEYAKEGLSLPSVVKSAIAWDRSMKTNAKQTAIEWLGAYGLTPQDLLQGQPQQYNQQQAPQGQQYQQPQYQPAQPEYLTREEAERIAAEKYESLQKEQEQKAVEYYNQRVVESFLNQKPLFKDPETAAQIEAEMAPVVQALTSTGRYSSPEEILETAYNYVVNGNPTFSSLLQKMTARPVIEQQQAVVQKAKAASRSITGSAGSGTPRIKAKSLRDNLRQRMGVGE